MGGNKEVIATLVTALTASPMIAGELAKRKAQNTGKDTNIEMVIARAPSDTRVKHDVIHSVSRSVEDKVDDGFDDKYGAGKDLKPIEKLGYLVQNFYMNPTLKVADQTLSKISVLIKAYKDKLTYTKESNKTVDSLVRKSRVAKKNKEYDKAILYIREALAIDNQNPNVYSALGGICYKQSDMKKAIWAIRKANKVQPLRVVDYMGLIKLYNQEQDWIKTYFNVKMIQILHPNNFKKKKYDKILQKVTQKCVSD